MNVPVVDISDLSAGMAGRRQRAADQLGRACETIGFAVVVGHGIDQALVESAFTQTRRLFALPAEEKMQAAWRPEAPNRGYDPPGHQRLDACAPPDHKEAWTFGPEHLVGSSGPMQAANVWPRLGGFRRAIEAYHLAAMDLAERLLEAMALSLGLPDSHFRQFHTRPVCSLRLLHYPPRATSAHPTGFGAGAHTDWGAVTVLAQDDAGTLEVQTTAGDWLEVPPIDGGFVVNVGDLLARWTNDRYTSTMHRVIGLDEEDRYSIACFYDLDHDAVIECLPTCCSEENPARYEPTTAGEHLQARFAASIDA